MKESEIVNKFLSEEGINNSVEKNQEVLPLTIEHLSEKTIRLPTDPETMLALASLILAEQNTNNYSGELIISGRIQEIMEKLGYYLSVIDPEEGRVLQKTDIKPYSESIEDAMDIGNGGVIFDPSSAHRNGNDLL